MTFQKILHFVFPPASLAILFVLQLTGWTRWGDNNEPVSPSEVDWGQLLLIWAILQVIYFADAWRRHRRAVNRPGFSSEILVWALGPGGDHSM